MRLELLCKKFQMNSSNSNFLYAKSLPVSLKSLKEKKIYPFPIPKTASPYSKKKENFLLLFFVRKIESPHSSLWFDVRIREEDFIVKT